jgi:hypothetical protein
MWLTKLITYINNNSEDAKDYLINNVGIKKFNGTDKVTKCKIIEEVANKVNLNTESIKYLINFIFSLGLFYKHRTYNKWYFKELEAIELFDKYKQNDLSETLKNIISKFEKEDNKHIDELLYLLNDYYVNLSDKFK